MRHNEQCYEVVLSKKRVRGRKKYKFIRVVGDGAIISEGCLTIYGWQEPVGEVLMFAAQKPEWKTVEKVECM